MKVKSALLTLWRLFFWALGTGSLSSGPLSLSEPEVRARFSFFLLSLPILTNWTKL